MENLIPTLTGKGESKPFPLGCHSLSNVQPLPMEWVPMSIPGLLWGLRCHSPISPERGPELRHSCAETQEKTCPGQFLTCPLGHSPKPYSSLSQSHTHQGWSLSLELAAGLWSLVYMCWGEPKKLYVLRFPKFTSPKSCNYPVTYEALHCKGTEVHLQRSYKYQSQVSIGGS